MPTPRVEKLIGSRIGAPFATAGEVFGEWVAIPTAYVDRWEKFVAESFDFVSPP